MAENQVEKVHGLLKDFKTAMLITSGGEFAHARPMAIAKIEPNCDLWFFTSRSSGKVEEIRDDAHVLIACQQEQSRYLTISGRAKLVTDRAAARELWTDSYKVWFPGGADDPDLMLIHVAAHQAEYWDNRGANGLRYILQAAKALATGTRPDIKQGDQQGKVAL